MISLEKALEIGLISDDVYEEIPKKCYCGGDIELTDTGVQAVCTNPFCYCKMANRLESMCKAMDIDDWGYAACEEVCRKFGLKSPFQALQLDIAYNKGLFTAKGVKLSALEKKIRNITDPSKRKCKLYEMVKYANIEGIDTVSYKLFGEFNTIEEAYEQFEKGQVPYIASKLGISDDSSVMAYRTYKNLMNHKGELLYGEKIFNIEKISGEPIKMAITGGVNGYHNKASFVDMLNERYPDAYFVLGNSVTLETQIVVADGDTSSNKFKRASSINNEYRHALLMSGKISSEQLDTYYRDTDLTVIGDKILITTSEELIKTLDRVYGGRWK